MAAKETIWEHKDPEDVYSLDQVVGHGNFGKVYKAQCKQTGEHVAIKILPIMEDDEQANATLVKEIKLMKSCNSVNIVKFQGSYMKDSELWIVMEYCDGGSVAAMIQKRGEGLSEQQIAVVMSDMLHGLDYLHSRHMLHRDIKADNVLLNSAGVAKLADLGVAAQLTNTMDNRSTATGTPYWMAPELIKEEGYSSEVDIWSLGITAVELAERKPPYFDMVPMRALFIIATGDNPPPTLKEKEKWSPEFHDFIAQCLIKDPKSRPNARNLLTHPFITGAPDRSVLKDYVSAYLTLKEEKRKEKEKKMAERRQGNKAKLVERLKDMSDTKGPPSPEDIFPVCHLGKCSLYKEPKPWGNPPLVINDNKTHQVLERFSNQQRVSLERVVDLLDMMINQRTGVERKTRVQRMRTHKDCFVGSDAVGWFLRVLKLDSREEATAIGESLMHRGLIYHVLRSEPFQDKNNMFYRFTPEDELDEQEQVYAGKITYLAEMMRWGIEIKTRRWRHKNYFASFSGKEAVNWFMENLKLESRSEATQFGQMLLDRGIFHHVLAADTFVDKDHLYRFYQDEPKKYKAISSQVRQMAFQKANSALNDLCDGAS